MPDQGSQLEVSARFATRLSWDDLTPAARRRTQLIVLDTLGCAAAAFRRGTHRPWVDALAQEDTGPEGASIWTRRTRIAPAQAALVNGTVTHHLELDDGHPGASVHGGVTIVPAAFACGELTGRPGRDVLAAIAAGYGVALACGAPLLPGLARHRMHPPAVNGVFGAAAAAAVLLDGSRETTAAAIGLAGLLAPLAPFEAFTRGATVKDLYGGWAAFVGVRSAQMARDGLAPPQDLFDAPSDGLASFVNHAPHRTRVEPDPEAVLGVQFKPFATCRSVQPTLTALESLLPVEADAVDRIDVETYPFAVELSEESDPATAIGAKVSIPWGVASLILDGRVDPDACSPDRLTDHSRRELAGRVRVRVAEDMIDPLVRGGRVVVTLADGTIRSSAVMASRWSREAPASENELRAKFVALTAGRAGALERAVDDLPGADGVAAVIEALAAVTEARA